MKAYITTARLSAPGLVTRYRCEVITEQDYHERGPWVNSFRVQHDDKEEAQRLALEFARKCALIIVSSAKDF